MRIPAILASAAMVLSLFLSWFTVPLPGAGGGFVPWDLVKEIEPSVDSLRRLADTLPVELLLVLATFPLAALFLILALVGLPSRLIALVTGGIACGVVAWALWRVRDAATGAVEDLGLDLPQADWGDLLGQAADSLGAGGWAWGAGAVVLFLSGLIGFGRGRA